MSAKPPKYAHVHNSVVDDRKVDDYSEMIPEQGFIIRASLYGFHYTGFIIWVSLYGFHCKCFIKLRMKIRADVDVDKHSK